MGVVKVREFLEKRGTAQLVVSHSLSRSESGGLFGMLETAGFA